MPKILYNIYYVFPKEFVLNDLLVYYIFHWHFETFSILNTMSSLNNICKTFFCFIKPN